MQLRSIPVDAIPGLREVGWRPLARAQRLLAMKNFIMKQKDFISFPISRMSRPLEEPSDPDKLSNIFSQILGACKSHSASWPFLKPVNPSDVPDYYDHIKYPMDFKLMAERIKKGYYVTRRLFMADMARVFSNCRIYNSPDTEYFR